MSNSPGIRKDSLCNSNTYWSPVHLVGTRYVVLAQSSVEGEPGSEDGGGRGTGMDVTINEQRSYGRVPCISHKNIKEENRMHLPTLTGYVSPTPSLSLTVRVNVCKFERLNIENLNLERNISALTRTHDA